MKIRLFGAVTLAFCLFFATGATAAIVTDTALAAPGVYFGTGNQNVDFTVLTDGNLELGLSAIIRFVGPALEIGDTYFVPPGLRPDGTSLWGVTFSVNTGTLNLSDYSFTAKITDLTRNGSIAIDPLQLQDNTYYQTSGGVITTAPPNYFTQHAAFTSFLGNQNGFQNSLPASAFLGFNGNILDNYRIDLSATRLTTGVISTDSISVASPEPATFGLIGFVLFGLGLAGSRRLHQRK